MRRRRKNSTKQAGLEAANWLLRLETGDPARAKARRDLIAYSKAFVKWLNRSPVHVRAFFEIVETDRKLRTFPASTGRPGP